MSAVHCVEYTVNRRPVSVCIREDAGDPDSLAIRRRDASIFLEFADVAPYVAPGSTVLDLGTHIGVASLYFLALGHPVTSFEPSSDNLRLLAAARTQRVRRLDDRAGGGRRALRNADVLLRRSTRAHRA